MQEFLDKVVLFWQQIDWTSLIQSLNNKYVYYVLGFFVLLLFVKKYFKRSVVRVKKTDGGEIVLSEDAISEIIEHVCADFSVVMQSRTKIITHGKGFDINVRVRIAFGAKIADITGDLQSKLTQTFANDIGIDKGWHINIAVVGFLSKSAADKIQKLYRKKYGDKLIIESEF